MAVPENNIRSHLNRYLGVLAVVLLLIPVILPYSITRNQTNYICSECGRTRIENHYYTDFWLFIPMQEYSRTVIFPEEDRSCKHNWKGPFYDSSTGSVIKYNSLRYLSIIMAFVLLLSLYSGSRSFNRISYKKGGLLSFVGRNHRNLRLFIKLSMITAFLLISYIVMASSLKIMSDLVPKEKTSGFSSLASKNKGNSLFKALTENLPDSSGNAEHAAAPLLKQTFNETKSALKGSNDLEKYIKEIDPESIDATYEKIKNYEKYFK
jgi:hypothetical protein